MNKPKPTTVEPADAPDDDLDDVGDLAAITMTIADIIARYHFTKHELTAELQTGRLRAAVNNATMSPEHTPVTFQALVDWLCNPETPPHLLAKYKNTRKPKH